jgi:hypothetical protein
MNYRRIILYVLIFISIPFYVKSVFENSFSINYKSVLYILIVLISLIDLIYTLKNKSLKN